MITIKSMMNGAVLVSGALVGLLLIPNVPFVGSASNLPSSDIEILLGAIVVIAAVGALVAFVVRRRRRSRGKREEHLEAARGWQARIFGLREKALVGSTGRCNTG